MRNDSNETGDQDGPHTRRVHKADRDRLEIPAEPRGVLTHDGKRDAMSPLHEAAHAEQEWTAVSVWNLMGQAAIDNRLLVKVADAHNVSLNKRDQLALAAIEEWKKLSKELRGTIQKLRTQLGAAQANLAKYRNYIQFPNDDTDTSALDAAIEKAKAEHSEYWRKIAEAHGCESLTEAFVKLTQLAEATKPLQDEITRMAWKAKTVDDAIINAVKGVHAEAQKPLVELLMEVRGCLTDDFPQTKAKIDAEIAKIGDK